MEQEQDYKKMYLEQKLTALQLEMQLLQNRFGEVQQQLKQTRAEHDELYGAPRGAPSEIEEPIEEEPIEEEPIEEEPIEEPVEEEPIEEIIEIVELVEEAVPEETTEIEPNPEGM